MNHCTDLLSSIVNFAEILTYLIPDRKSASPIPLYNIERSFFGIAECLR